MNGAANVLHTSINSVKSGDPFQTPVLRICAIWNVFAAAATRRLDNFGI